MTMDLEEFQFRIPTPNGGCAVFSFESGTGNMDLAPANQLQSGQVQLHPPPLVNNDTGLQGAKKTRRKRKSKAEVEEEGDNGNNDGSDPGNKRLKQSYQEIQEYVTRQKKLLEVLADYGYPSRPKKGEKRDVFNWECVAQRCNIGSLNDCQTMLRRIRCAINYRINNAVRAYNLNRESFQTDEAWGLLDKVGCGYQLWEEARSLIRSIVADKFQLHEPMTGFRTPKLNQQMPISQSGSSSCNVHGRHSTGSIVRESNARPILLAPVRNLFGSSTQCGDPPSASNGNQESDAVPQVSGTSATAAESTDREITTAASNSSISAPELGQTFLPNIEDVKEENEWEDADAEETEARDPSQQQGSSEPVFGDCTTRSPVAAPPAEPNLAADIFGITIKSEPVDTQQGSTQSTNNSGNDNDNTTASAVPDTSNAFYSIMGNLRNTNANPLAFCLPTPAAPFGGGGIPGNNAQPSHSASGLVSDQELNARLEVYKEFQKFAFETVTMFSEEVIAEFIDGFQQISVAYGMMNGPNREVCRQLFV